MSTLDSTIQAEGDFLPNLCSVQAVFALVIVGELLALVFVVIARSAIAFDWLYFGMVSFLMQWIVLTSAATLCPLRPWFRHKNSYIAGVTSYAIVLAITCLFTALGQFILHGAIGTAEWVLVIENFLIAAVFAGIVLRYFFLQQQLQNQQKAELQARVQALRARIRPHFLFNSMNTIASLISIDPEAAEKMIVDLAQIFRASLETPGMVSLADELDLCRRFVDVEKYRLAERLQVDWQIDALNLDDTIPSLLLQPLIENAIYHGVQPLPEGGIITIAGKTIDDKNVIKIMNPVFRSAASPDEHSGGRHSRPHELLEPRGNGIALDNIKNRLNAHYAGQASFEIVDSENVFSVTVSYPGLYTRRV